MQKGKVEHPNAHAKTCISMKGFPWGFGRRQLPEKNTRSRVRVRTLAHVHALAHTRTRARTRARHARTHALTYARARARTHTHVDRHSPKLLRFSLPPRHRCRHHRQHRHPSLAPPTSSPRRGGSIDIATTAHFNCNRTRNRSFQIVNVAHVHSATLGTVVAFALVFIVRSFPIGWISAHVYIC